MKVVKDDRAVCNLHFDNSIVKYIASQLATALAQSGCIVRDASTGWLGDMSPGDGFTGLVSTIGTVVFAIHYDDLITEEYVNSCMDNNLRLFAVISADPGRPYAFGGITYDYDPD